MINESLYASYTESSIDDSRKYGISTQELNHFYQISKAFNENDIRTASILAQKALNTWEQYDFYTLWCYINPENLTPQVAEKMIRIYKTKNRILNEIDTEIHRPTDFRRPTIEIDTGFFGLKMEILDVESLYLVHPLNMIKTGDWENANESLNKIPKFTHESISVERTPHGHNWHFIRSLLFYRTKRWIDLIKSCENLKTAGFKRNPKEEKISQDYHILAAALLMKAEAFVRLNSSEYATKILKNPLFDRIEGNEQIPLYAKYLLGLIYKKLGNTSESDSLLSTVRTLALSTFSENTATEIITNIDDKNYIFKTSSEATIAKRSSYWDYRTEPDLADVERSERSSERERLLAEVDEEMSKQIGMEVPKREIYNLKAKIRFDLVREEKGLKTDNTSRHTLFLGAPGTNKTSFAKILNKIYYAYGITKYPDRLVSVSRDTLVDSIVGGSEKRTNEALNRSAGGIFFVDEAYNLIQESEGQKDVFGRAVLDTILLAMENRRDEIICIFAGYKDLLYRLLDYNPGMKSRFNHYIDFPSYSPKEIADIAGAIAEEKEYKLSIESKVFIKYFLENVPARSEGSNPKNMIDMAGNGRFARNIVERSIELLPNVLLEKYGESLKDLDAEELMLLDLDIVSKSTIDIFKNTTGYNRFIFDENVKSEILKIVQNGQA